MKKALIVSVLSVAVVCFGVLNAFAQANAKAAKPAVAPAKAPAQPPQPPAQKIPRANFAIITGSITKIDNSDPNNIKLEVTNDADGTAHTISITPWTNVTKVTDVSELKSGDTVRVMSRKIDDKEIAMGVMFGKIRKVTPPPAAQPAASVPAQTEPKQ